MFRNRQCLNLIAAHMPSLSILLALASRPAGCPPGGHRYQWRGNGEARHTAPPGFAQDAAARQASIARLAALGFGVGSPGGSTEVEEKSDFYYHSQGGYSVRL